MRLINTRTLQLEDFTLKDKPKYAILSHTWGEDELTCQDMLTQERMQKQGWAKIEMTCRKATEHGYGYAWVDTCCIDKTSSAELSEAINSMFRWYQNAAICYVYLADLEDDSEDAFFNCRWWTRGWTLQELLAPEDLIFYNATWVQYGTKLRLVHQIAERIPIPVEVLRSWLNPKVYKAASILSWASYRNTTRLEDEAYCLLGLFGVNMSMLYGEGRGAFRRLQEEILRIRADLSILAFDSQSRGFDRTHNLLADSPSQFRSASRNSIYVDRKFKIGYHNDVFIMNNRLRLSRPFNLVVSALDGRESVHYAIEDADADFGNVFHTPLIKTAPGQFARCGGLLPRPQSGMGGVISTWNKIDARIALEEEEIWYDAGFYSWGTGICWPNQSCKDIVAVQPSDYFDHVQQGFFESFRDDEIVAIQIQIRDEHFGSIEDDIVPSVDQAVSGIRYAGRAILSFRKSALTQSRLAENSAYRWSSPG